MSVPIIGAVHRWHCPACGLEDVTSEPRPHTRMHNCPRTRGLALPMLPAGTSAKFVVNEREDYVGSERPQLDPELGRPVMSVQTVRDDGEDCTVYAPTVVANLSAS